MTVTNDFDGLTLPDCCPHCGSLMAAEDRAARVMDAADARLLAKGAIIARTYACGAKLRICEELKHEAARVTLGCRIAVAEAIAKNTPTVAA